MVAYILLFIMFLILALLVYSENRTTKPPLKKEAPKPKVKKKTERPVSPEETEAQAKKAKEELKKATELQKERARQRAQREAQRAEELRRSREEETRKKAEEKAAREAAEAKLKEEAKKAAAKKKAEEEAQRAQAERKALAEEEAQQRAEAERKAREEAEAKREAQEAAKEKEVKTLPAYPDFDHSRLVEMGLSDDEAKEFVMELIPQIEEQLPLIEKALQEGNFHQMERLTHSIKGSSTNIGTGGIADLLIDCNTYLKTGTDPLLAKSYYEELKVQLGNLKTQYL